MQTKRLDVNMMGVLLANFTTFLRPSITFNKLKTTRQL